MSPENTIRAIAKNLNVIKAQLENVDKVAAIFKPSTDKWCMLEVLCHLVDEEKEDFRTRVQYVLEDPSKPLSKFDPTGWVVSRNYMDQNFEAKAEEFFVERTKSINWLDSLEKPQWDNTYHHPKLGSMSAALFLANWLAHDYIHIRQLNRLAYEYHQYQSEIDLTYAGNW
ncbi:MAG: hypothetical protein DRI71_06005 [Bacteroidetes bacterium]|nr:MAG: hypothetical protein DRI71_06005 [Bacteroidota bacterium]